VLATDCVSKDTHTRLKMSTKARQQDRADDWDVKQAGGQMRGSSVATRALAATWLAHIHFVRCIFPFPISFLQRQSSPPHPTTTPTISQKVIQASTSRWWELSFLLCAWPAMPPRRRQQQPWRCWLTRLARVRIAQTRKMCDLTNLLFLDFLLGFLRQKKEKGG
jgi:hypothetical protein